jgi:hypothetical protein
MPLERVGSRIELTISTIKQAGCSSALIDERSSETPPRVWANGRDIEDWLKVLKESGRRGEQKTELDSWI